MIIVSINIIVLLGCGLSHALAKTSCVLIPVTFLFLTACIAGLGQTVLHAAKFKKQATEVGRARASRGPPASAASLHIPHPSAASPLPSPARIARLMPSPTLPPPSLPSAHCHASSPALRLSRSSPSTTSPRPRWPCKPSIRRSSPTDRYRRRLASGSPSRHLGGSARVATSRTTSTRSVRVTSLSIPPPPPRLPQPNQICIALSARAPCRAHARRLVGRLPIQHDRHCDLNLHLRHRGASEAHVRLLRQLVRSPQRHRHQRQGRPPPLDHLCQGVDSARPLARTPPSRVAAHIDPALARLTHS